MSPFDGFSRWLVARPTGRHFNRLMHWPWSIPLLGLVPMVVGQDVIGPTRPSLILQSCTRPHIIAHRGASGYLPEHTLQAYRLAIDLGVDYIEPDLVLTKDGHLVCRHDVDLTETTDVASRPEFRDRLRNVTLPSALHVELDGEAREVVVEGYFSFDFTLAEIKGLKAKQRLTQRSTTYNGFFEVPTFEEVIDMVREAEKAVGRPIGIYAEIKEPYFFHLNGHDIESKLVETLQHKDMLRSANPHYGPPPSSPDDTHEAAPAPLIIQCFDQQTLLSLSTRIPDIPLVQLLLAPQEKQEGDGISHILQREGIFGQIPLSAIATYAHGIGPQKSIFTGVAAEEGRAIVEEAHRLGLAVHPWTFRREASFVGGHFSGDSDRELRYFLECLNVDALFVEQPDQAGAIVEQMLRDDHAGGAQNATPKTRGVAMAMSTATAPTQAHTQAHRELKKSACMSKRRTRSCSAHSNSADPLSISAAYYPRWVAPKRRAATA